MELNVIRQADPQVADAIEAELNRQRSHIELIASENFVSPAVMAAMGSCLTNKYAEGYPAHRYYGGCECVDVVETSPVTALSSFSAASTSTCSRIPARRRIRRCISPCSSRAIPSWA